MQLRGLGRKQTLHFLLASAWARITPNRPRLPLLLLARLHIGTRTLYDQEDRC